jgi:hypothetical protein
VVGFDLDCFEMTHFTQKHFVADSCDAVFHEVGLNVEVALFVLREHCQNVHIYPLQLDNAVLGLAHLLDQSSKHTANDEALDRVLFKLVRSLRQNFVGSGGEGEVHAVSWTIHSNLRNVDKSDHRVFVFAITNGRHIVFLVIFNRTVLSFVRLHLSDNLN